MKEKPRWPLGQMRFRLKSVPSELSAFQFWMRRKQPRKPRKPTMGKCLCTYFHEIYTRRWWKSFLTKKLKGSLIFQISYLWNYFAIQNSCRMGFSSIESIRFVYNFAAWVSILPFYRPYSIKRHKSSPFLQEWVFLEVFFIYIYNKGAFTKPSFKKNVGSSYGDRS